MNTAASLLGLTESVTFELSIIAASIAAILVGFAPSYLVFYLHRPDSQTFLDQHHGLSRLRDFMLAGYGFDALYLTLLVKPLSKISSAVREIQTGILAKNLWPMLAVLIILALWVVFNL